MSRQPRALRIAEDLDRSPDALDSAAADLIRLQHALIHELSGAVLAADLLRSEAQRYADGDPRVPWASVRELLGIWFEAHENAVRLAKEQQ